MFGLKMEVFVCVWKVEVVGIAALEKIIRPDFELNFELSLNKVATWPKLLNDILFMNHHLLLSNLAYNLEDRKLGLNATCWFQVVLGLLLWKHKTHASKAKPALISLFPSQTLQLLRLVSRMEISDRWQGHVLACL